MSTRYFLSYSGVRLPLQLVEELPEPCVAQPQRMVPC